MKKSHLATAIKAASVVALAACSMTVFAETTGPDIYGQVRMSMTYDDADERAQLASGNSRLGFKGTSDLTENTKLEYRLEYRIDVAESSAGSTTNFAARHGYLAFDNKKYGKILVGRTISHDDYLSTSVAWWRGTGIGYGTAHDAAWVNNTFVYTSPKFNGDKTQFFAQYGMDEGVGGARSFNTFKDGVATTVERDFIMAGVMHEGEKANLNAAYTRAGGDLSSLRLSGTYKASDALTLLGLTQYTDYNSDDNELGLFAGAEYKINEPWSAWVEASFVDNVGGVASGEYKGINIGAKRDFSKSTFAFGNIGYADDAADDVVGVEVGMVHRF
ncbi:MAG: porin [Moraxella sp.]|nr:porin [Moraxella sp.]